MYWKRLELLYFLKRPNSGTALRMFLIGTLWALMMLSLWSVRPAQAAVIAVNTTGDELNSDGDCSLREAIRAANENMAVSGCTAGSGADTIILPAGNFVLTRSGLGENDAVSGDLDITEEVTIIGAGKAETIVDGNGLDRIFEVNVPSGKRVEISHLMVTGGNPGGDFGGGIFIIGGVVTLNHLRVRDNADNGAIAVFGSATVTIMNSRLSDNVSAVSGGAVANYGTIYLRHSLVDGNEAAHTGGGVWSQGTLVVLNSTLSGNSSDLDGGGISNSGTVVLYNATIANNTADANGNDSGNGGGIYNSSGGDFDFRNSIIGDNADLSNAGPQQPDCAGTFFSYGFSLIENLAGCTITGTGAGNVTGVSPLLGPLNNNGGPTLTHALQAGSPAIDGGSSGGCASGVAGVELTVDQRGFARPIDGDGDGDAVCDMGAFERLSPGAPTATPTAPPTKTPEVTATKVKATATATVQLSSTPTTTTTPEPSPTATFDPEFPPTATATATVGPSPTATATFDPEFPPTATSTVTPGASPTPTATFDPEFPPTATSTVTPGPSPTATTPFVPSYWLYLPVNPDD